MPTRPPLALLVFVVGAATLGAEIAAARLLAPSFGASTIVWANTIAVVLVALSIGYRFGGRYGDRHPSIESLCRVVLVASVILAIVPIVAKPFLNIAVDALDAISAGAFVGSLVGVLVLVATPVAILGAVAPWAIRLQVDSVEKAGEEAGRLYAISTVGSLLGTFLSALLMIPLIGTQRTFITFALVIAVVAAFGATRRWALVPLFVAALLAVPVGSIKDDDKVVLHERETDSQYARVTVGDDGSRRLELNEGQAWHSVWKPGTVLTGGVWDAYVVLPLSVLGKAPRSMAMLGTGAGTTVRAYERYFPDSAIDAVEIDGELLEIGKEYFELRERPGVRLIEDDARPFLRKSDGGYDAIMVDAYRQPYIPFYLTTKEFFRLAKARLRPGGAVMVNAAHPEDAVSLEEVLSAGLHSAFANVQRFPVTRFNTILVASDGPIDTARMQTAAAATAPELGELAVEYAAETGAAPVDARDPYTDDRAPVEWLIDTSIVEYAAGGGEGIDGR